MGDWDRVVGVATYYELTDPGIESHGGEGIFHAHPEGPKSLPTSFIWLLCILRDKAPERVADRPPASRAKVANGLELHLRLSSVRQCAIFTFTFIYVYRMESS